MEKRSRIIGHAATPRFAKMVSWKYGQLPASKVSEDLELHHSRKTSRKLIQRIGEEVGQIAGEKEFEWHYDIPEFNEVITHVAVSRDGTTTPIIKDGYRETMCGTLSFYNAKGDRIHTIYAACAPEYGKDSFDRVMDMELVEVKKRYPKLKYIGLADGAKNNWSYLQNRTDVQILDFFHATEYLAEVSAVMKKNEPQRKVWLQDACHDLKHKTSGTAFIIRELKAHRKQLKTSSEILDKTITYFENNRHRMNYPAYQKQGFPIGSGVTEAACKVVVKQRLSNSGMRWTCRAVQHTLLIRGLICTEGRWKQFWNKIDREGL